MDGALVRRELAEVQRVRLGQRTFAAPGTCAQIGDVHRVRDDLHSHLRELGRSCAQVGRDRGADGYDGVRSGQPLAFAAQVPPHVRDHRQGGRPRGPSSRLNAPHHAPRGTARTQGRLVACVNEVRPVADRPVVPDGAHGWNTCPPGCGDGRQAGQHVLPVRDVDPLAAQNVRQYLRQRAIEPLVLEVVSDVGQWRRRKTCLDDPEAVVFGFYD